MNVVWWCIHKHYIYGAKTVAIGKELLTLNCDPHSVTWFIVITLLLININNTVTIRRGMLDVHVDQRVLNFGSCLLSCHEQTIVQLIME